MTYSCLLDNFNGTLKKKTKQINKAIARGHEAGWRGSAQWGRGVQPEWRHYVDRHVYEHTFVIHSTMGKYYWVDALSLRRPGGQKPVVCLKTTTGTQGSSLSSFIPNHDSYVSGDSTISYSNYASSVNYFACLSYPLPQNNIIIIFFLTFKYYS